MVRRPRVRSRGDDLATDVFLRLAVLLSAGLSPVVAWRHLAFSTGASVSPAAAVSARRPRSPDRVGCETVRAAAEAVADGGDVARVLRRAGGSWRDVAAVWAVATAVGAPLADTLRRAVTGMRDARDVRDDVRVALTEPRSTARLLAILPLAAVPLGGLLGVDVWGALTADVLGATCGVSGVILVAISRAWSRRLERAAEPPDVLPGLRAELFAVALSGGVSVPSARALVDEAVPDTPLTPLGASASRDDGVDEALALSESAGVPAIEVLRASAWLQRQRARTEGRARAAELSTRLLVPLGVCTLPAFLLLAVAPMILAVLRSEAFVLEPP